MSLDIRLRHSFGAFDLDVAFTAPEGVTALFGRSGSGKSTIVKAIAGLLRPDAGHVSIDGTVLLDTSRQTFVPVHCRRVGCVFQEGRLFPHLNVHQNLRFGQRFAARTNRAPLDGVVDLLGLRHLLQRRPGALSGGEKQRVAIGRALLSAPRLLLMDEPLASLDEARKDEILPYLARLRDETRLPMIYVSHSLPEVARLATTIVAIDGGRVQRVGPASELLADPEAVPALGVRSAGAVLPARIIRHDAEDGLTELATSGGSLFLPHVDAPVGAELRVRIEAHDVMIARVPPSRISALNVLAAEVTAIREGDGPGAAVGLRIGDDRLLARITGRSVRNLGLAPGVSCYAVIKSTSIARGDIGMGA